MGRCAAQRTRAGPAKNHAPLARDAYAARVIDAATGIGLVLVALLLLALLPRKSVGGSGLQLFSSLFPAWRFFEEVEPAPLLEYRVLGPDAVPGAWTRLISAPRRRLRNLLLDADGNLALACHSLIERLIADIGDAEITELGRAAQLVSYRLVERLVVHALPSGFARADVMLQFKLTQPSEFDDQAPEEILVSEPFPAQKEAPPRSAGADLSTEARG